MLNVQEMQNLLEFLHRVETKGAEAYVWVGLVEKIKAQLNELQNLSKQDLKEINEKIDIS